MVIFAFPFVMVDLTLLGVSWLLAYQHVVFCRAFGVEFRYALSGWIWMFPIWP